MAREDYERWEARYAGRGPGELGAVDPFLAGLADDLPSSGRALDVAGGTGRHAIFLAQKGLVVTIVDVSPRGLAIAASAAADRGLSLATQEMDLDEGVLPAGLFDFIWCSWFLVSAALWREIGRVLAPGGRVAYVQPTQRNLERHARPSARYLLDVASLDTELQDAGLRITGLEVDWDSNGNHTARLLACRDTDRR